VSTNFEIRVSQVAPKEYCKVCGKPFVLSDEFIGVPHVVFVAVQNEDDEKYFIHATCFASRLSESITNQ
jgi:hypothetical protein